MNLQQKIVAAILAFMGALVIVLALVANLILMRSFATLEEQDAAENTSRALNAYQQRLDSLSRTARDYAEWDSTFDFVNGEYPDYPESEMPVDGLANIDLNLVAITDLTGTPLLEIAYNANTLEEQSFPAAIRNNLPSLVSGSRQANGILQGDDGAMYLVATNPILSSTGEQPANGMLLVGRSLDPQVVDQISELTHQDLSIKQMDGSDLDSYDSAALESLSAADQPTAFEVIDAEHAAGYAIIHDLDGKPALLLRVDLDRSMYAQGQAAMRGLLITLAVIAILFTIVAFFQVRRLLTNRLVRLTNVATRVARGETTVTIPPDPGKDEISLLVRAFQAIQGYLSQAAGAAHEVAEGNLTVQVEPVSAQDELGQALQRMTENLRQTQVSIRGSADEVDEAARELANTALNTGESTRQVAHTLQQIATGITQQSESTARTVQSMSLMKKALQNIIAGSESQSQAVERLSALTEQMNGDIKEVTGIAEALAERSNAASAAAKAGSQTVSRTVQGMDLIRSAVNQSAGKVQEMGRRSEQIGSISETIRSIASQTNLLALNAAIEAARASGKTMQLSQLMLQNHLVGVATMLAEVDERCAVPLSETELAEMARRARIDTLLLTDADGVIVQSNETSILGFRFPEDPREQASVFRPLLKQRDGIVTQPPQARSKDNVPFMWVGVSRRKQSGIIQAGMTVESIARYSLFSQGFAVVADEVRKLADQAGLSAREINALIQEIQASVRDAVSAMRDSRLEIERGVEQAHAAGAELERLLQAANQAAAQAGKVSEAAARMSAGAGALVGAVDTVGQVAEENRQATHRMGQAANDVAEAMDNIASISEENSAAVEEVSAATGEMAQQAARVAHEVQDLQAMAEDLQKLIRQYRMEEAPPVPQALILEPVRWN